MAASCQQPPVTKPRRFSFEEFQSTAGKLKRVLETCLTLPQRHAVNVKKQDGQPIDHGYPMRVSFSTAAEKAGSIKMYAHVASRHIEIRRAEKYAPMSLAFGWIAYGS